MCQSGSQIAVQLWVLLLLLLVVMVVVLLLLLLLVLGMYSQRCCG